jgi:hypothetical protein
MSAPARNDQALVVFFARALADGQTLWTQTEPSFVWLPFFLMRSLHLGHVPMTVPSIHSLVE